MAYDPAFAYEIAVIIEEGIRRMHENDEDVFYYLTVGNENYLQAKMPEGSRDGILRGLYRFGATVDGQAPAVHLLGSGAILNETIKAQSMLADRYGVAADVWSATNYKQLQRDAQDTERWNMLHPDQPPRRAYVSQCFDGSDGVFVAASDYMKVLPESIARFLPGPLVSLGTDGFGRSEDRATLRDFFEVDARYIAVAALHALARQGRIDPAIAAQAVKDMDIDPEKVNPVSC